jgi:CelD/BcsL family acetyltransferase involved in cellulose biosynthesis
LTVDVVDRPEGFDALRPEWNAAAATQADPNVFLTWEWLATWWRHLGVRHPGARLHVVTVRDGDGLVLAAPLFRAEWGYGPLRTPVLHQVSYDAGDYGGVLLVRRSDEAVAALAAHLADVLRHDAGSVVLSRLTTDSRFLAVLRSALGGPAAGRSPGTGRSPHRVAIAATEAPILDSACPYALVDADFDLARRQKRHRVRQRLARLGEHHDVAFRLHTGAALEDGLARFVAVHRRRWDDRADTMQGQLVDPAREAFLLDAARALDAAGHLRLTTLQADGATAAANLDYELAGRLYMFKTAFDPGFGRHAPGHLLVSHVFDEGLARGVHEFDFMRGEHDYKRGWTNRSRHLVTVRLTRPGLNGYVAGWRTRAAQTTTRYLHRARPG